MSTSCYIGLKQDEDVGYTSCHCDGYLSFVGVFLYLFYNKPDRISELLKLGELSSIGYNIKPPKVFTDYREANLYYVYMLKHIKTTFVLTHKPYRTEGYKIKTVKFKNFRNIEVNNPYLHSYYYDKKTKKWYVAVPSSTKYYSLEEIFTNKSAYEKFKLETQYFESYETIQETIEDIMLDIKSKEYDRSIIGTYNDWLHESKLGVSKSLEIGYSNRNGKRVYALFLKEDGKKRRKCVKYSECIGDLMSYLETVYGIR